MKLCLALSGFILPVPEITTQSCFILHFGFQKFHSRHFKVQYLTYRNIIQTVLITQLNEPVDFMIVKEPKLYNNEEADLHANIVFAHRDPCEKNMVVITAGILSKKLKLQPLIEVNFSHE